MTLERYLTQNKITSERFARRIRLSLSSVNKYRIGERMPRPDIVERIRRATNGRVRPEDWYRR